MNNQDDYFDEIERALSNKYGETDLDRIERELSESVHIPVKTDKYHYETPSSIDSKPTRNQSIPNVVIRSESYDDETYMGESYMGEQDFIRSEKDAMRMERSKRPVQGVKNQPVQSRKAVSDTRRTVSDTRRTATDTRRAVPDTRRTASDSSRHVTSSKNSSTVAHKTVKTSQKPVNLSKSSSSYGKNNAVPAKNHKSDDIKKGSVKKRKVDDKNTKGKPRKKSGCLTAFLVVLIFLVGFTAFLGFTKPGNKLLLRASSIYARKVMKEDPEGNAEPFEAPSIIPNGWIYDDKVVNVLLIGVEQIEGANNTDSMILASENLETGKITLVSFLRDTYVEIYGFDKWRKLNYAYPAGGIDTLINTLQNTYKFYINSYAYVSFDDFEDVIDALGGVDIELTEEEADYLNETNYVSNYDYHNLEPGMNHMNGNQALGYCRVRKIETLEGVNDDFGRTLRQRKVMKSVFDKYKDQSLPSLVKTTNEVLECITTNMTSGNIYTLLEGYYEHRDGELGQLMIPAMEYMEGMDIDDVGSVLSIEGYEEDNIRLLHETLYGRYNPE